MKQFLRTFMCDENGAVTVDWVVLAAAVVGLAAAIVTAMQANALSLTGSIASFLAGWAF
ncbi:MAG: hypothetical protein ABJR46_09150 [Tateyamaria sp.]|uniref:hypothetical protein n=1 Tax=Tateyamaria sp. TaxID=1929288 RepID=UPI00329544F7